MTVEETRAAFFLRSLLANELDPFEPFFTPVKNVLLTFDRLVRNRKQRETWTNKELGALLEGHEQEGTKEEAQEKRYEKDERMLDFKLLRWLGDTGASSSFYHAFNTLYLVCTMLRRLANKVCFFRLKLYSFYWRHHRNWRIRRMNVQISEVYRTINCRILTAISASSSNRSYLILC